MVKKCFSCNFQLLFFIILNNYLTQLLVKVIIINFLNYICLPTSLVGRLNLSNKFHAWDVMVN